MATLEPLIFSRCPVLPALESSEAGIGPSKSVPFTLSNGRKLAVEKGIALA